MPRRAGMHKSGVRMVREKAMDGFFNNLLRVCAIAENQITGSCAAIWHHVSPGDRVLMRPCLARSLFAASVRICVCPVF